MKTPTTIEALESAIETLENMLRGSGFDAREYIRRLDTYKAARDEHRRLEMIGERNREQIRELAVRRRKGFQSGA